MANSNSFIPFFFLPQLFIITTTTTLVLENALVVKGFPDLTFISYWCGTEYDVTGFRKGQARRVTNTAVSLVSTMSSPICSVTNEDKGTPLMYSMATCPDSVPIKDCAACITYAQDQLLNYNICNDQYGAQITVASCSLRYETYPIPGCPVSQKKKGTKM